VFGRRKSTTEAAEPDEFPEFRVPAWVTRTDKVTRDLIKEAHERGHADGKRGVPGPNDADSAVFNKYTQEAEKNLAAVAQTWRETNRTLRGEWCRLLLAVKELHRQAAELRPGLKKLEKRVDDAQRALDQRRAELHAKSADTLHRISRPFYIFIMTCIFIADVPLNSKVFQVFGENQLASWALSAVLGAAIVAFGHVLGIELRTGLKNRVLIALVIAVPVAFVLSMAFVRVKYLEAVDEEAVLGGFSGFAVISVINLALFGAAAVTSYLRHDPHERAIEIAAADVSRAKAEHDALYSRVTMLEASANATEARAAQLRVWGEEEFAKAKNWADTERNWYEQLMQEYRAANQAAREHGDQVIEALEEWKRPSTPPDLEHAQTLEWECT
jgi:uncharacterized protein YlxW (UPF0749 family)